MESGEESVAPHANPISSPPSGPEGTSPGYSKFDHVVADPHPEVESPLSTARGTPPPDDDQDDDVTHPPKPESQMSDDQEDNDDDDDDEQGQKSQDQRPDRFQASASRELIALQKAAEIYHIPKTLAFEGRVPRRKPSAAPSSRSPSTSARQTPAPVQPPSRPRGRPPKSREPVAVQQPTRRGRKRKLDQDTGPVRTTPARGNKGSRTMKEPSSSEPEGDSDGASESENNHVAPAAEKPRTGRGRGRQKKVIRKEKSSDDAGAGASLASISRSSSSPAASDADKDGEVDQVASELVPTSSIVPMETEGTSSLPLFLLYFSPSRQLILVHSVFISPRAS
jgi:hypothetical protein